MYSNYNSILTDNTVHVVGTSIGGTFGGSEHNSRLVAKIVYCLSLIAFVSDHPFDC